MILSSSVTSVQHKPEDAFPSHPPHMITYESVIPFHISLPKFCFFLLGSQNRTGVKESRCYEYMIYALFLEAGVFSCHLGKMLHRRRHTLECPLHLMCLRLNLRVFRHMLDGGTKRDGISRLQFQQIKKNECVPNRI